MNNLSLPSPNGNAASDMRPVEKLVSGVTIVAIIALILYYWNTYIAPFVLGLLDTMVHMAFLGCILFVLGYLLFSKRMHLVYRVLVRYFTSIFANVFPLQIIEDKLQQMKKRRDKMNQQISLVAAAIQKLKRIIQQNAMDANKGFGGALEARKMATNAQDDNQAHRMELEQLKLARKAQRRNDANIGYQALLEKLQKVYNFLSRYADNVDFFIEDTEDEIEQKKTEYTATGSAFKAMKTAMEVIQGNATENDIYNQAFASIENTVSTQLGIMEDLQRVSQGFMDGMEVEKGAVDDAALQALNAFEQKALNPGNGGFNMVTSTVRNNAAVRVPALSSGSSSSDFDPFK